ncbi:MAG: isoleucine--tRNA ligase, partial [Pseudomonadota bacterium]|nr:isoleucine--tRNA ligase [Pseudomonadota bacterium]
MTDYKPTLNLPETDFPMKANLPQREPEMLRFWSELNLFEKLQAQRADKKKFILHDGPPYANGNTHIGHALNKTLKDTVMKAKLMSGYNVPYVPGWDCHGLPIELNVEKKIGKAGVQVSSEVFRAASREYAQSQVELQRDEFMRLGVIGDWYNPYRTMDFSYEADIIRALGKIIANGHLVHGRKPVHWCVDCGSALAEAEVEYKDKTSHAIDVAFTVMDQAALFARLQFSHAFKGEVEVPIWTTTPWTLPANEAVAFNPKHTYALVEAQFPEGKRYFIVAEALLSAVMQRYGADQYHVLASKMGAEFEGLLLQHPFLPREVPIVLGDHVTLDAGTGAVHTAPAHGQDDYAVGARYHLPMHNPVDDRGCFFEDVKFVGGQHVFKANENIIALLQQNGKLMHETSITHSYPHCWRHKTPLIFRATPQWFISMDKNGLRAQALAAIAATQWVPEWGEARIAEMVANRPDWCISRQRVWGTPMPLFIDPKTFKLHPDTLLFIEEVAQLVEQQGVEAWDALDPKTLLGDAHTEYVKVTDTLDVWFDAGVSHAAVLARRPELQFPADLYMEGSDQHRGWFQSSLLTSVAMQGVAPFKAVLTHGFAVDAEGHKMSKSLGNVIAPEKVIQRLGADVLRLWVATTDYRGEMTVSDEI